MADQPNPPPPVQLPPLGPIVGAMLLGIVKSRFLWHSLATVGGSFLTVWLLGRQVESMWERIREEIPGGRVLPRLLPEAPKLLPRKTAAEGAIGRVFFGNKQGSGTVVGPVYTSDRQIHILTAAHCVPAVHSQGKFRDSEGRTLAVRCVSRDPNADAAWLVADRPQGEVAYLCLSVSGPGVGESVWHAGFGRDRPGNREVGTYLGCVSNCARFHFRLNCSHGDSGGGIVLGSDDSIISAVSTSSKVGHVADVFGPSLLAIRRLRPAQAVINLTYPVIESGPIGS